MGTQKRNSVYIYYHNKKKEYFYLSTFTIKPKKKKKKNFDYSKCYYLLETYYIYTHIHRRE